MQNQNRKERNRARVVTTAVLALCILGVSALAATPMVHAATCRVYHGGQVLLECSTDGKGVCAAGHFESPSFSGDGCFAADYP